MEEFVTVQLAPTKLRVPVGASKEWIFQQYQAQLLKGLQVLSAAEQEEDEEDLSQANERLEQANHLLKQASEAQLQHFACSKFYSYHQLDVYFQLTHSPFCFFET